jgi:hypothetical protein
MNRTDRDFYDFLLIILFILSIPVNLKSLPRQKPNNNIDSQNKRNQNKRRRPRHIMFDIKGSGCIIENLHGQRRHRLVMWIFRNPTDR